MKDWQEVVIQKERQKYESEKIKLYFLVIEAAIVMFLIGYVLGAIR